MKGFHAKIDMKEDARRRYFKARSVLIALKQKVDSAISKLENDEILSPVRYSEWAIPIVPIMKSDATVWICSDFKTTVNPQHQNSTLPSAAS